MKNYLFVLILGLITLNAFAQNSGDYKSFASATKMNVLYIGVDNPVEVVVPGIQPEKMIVSVTNGTIITSGPYKYILKPIAPGNLTLTVSTEVDGKTVEIGKHDFRVKRIMDPVPMVAGMNGGIISKTLLLQQTNVFAVIMNFDFDVMYVVTSFTVSATVGSFEESKTTNSSKITPEMKSLIEKLNPGDKVYFSDINVKGPDGIERPLGTMVFYLE